MSNPLDKDEEDRRIKALVETPALNWSEFADHRKNPGGAAKTWRCGFVTSLQLKRTPEGYIRRRCHVPGHFLQHCPANGDSNYDFKRVSPPTGIPKPMLKETPCGSYRLQDGTTTTLQPKEAIFEKEMTSLPTMNHVRDIPPEFYCPLCKEVMKYAVVTSKCCFESFCDKCIRNHFISKSMCVCGATNTVADHLLPNMTLRGTINRILKSDNSSSGSLGTRFQVQDMKSTYSLSKLNASTTTPAAAAAASNGEQKSPPAEEHIAINAKVKASDANTVVTHQMTSETANRLKKDYPSKGGQYPLPDKEKTLKAKVKADGANMVITHQMTSEVVKTSKRAYASEGRPLLTGESEKQKKRRRQEVPSLANPTTGSCYMFPQAEATPYNPYWTQLQFGMNGFVGSYASYMPYMRSYGQL